MKKLLFFAFLLVPSLASAQDPAVITERGVPVHMRDGVILYADIFRPAKPGRYPVLLERTPYDKGNDKEIDLDASGPSHGFVVIIQDVRGRYTSEGEWYPFRHESEDGADTVEWAAQLPYSDGRVGMFGSSYVGATQMLAAIAHPEHLAGIFPMFTPSNYHNGWVYVNGAFQQWFSQTWTSILARDTVDRYLKKSMRPELDNTLPVAQYPLFHLDQPLGPDGMTARFAPYYVDWLAHPNYDDYWRPWTIANHYSDIHIPGLTVAAWYDIFLNGTLENYQGTAALRKDQQLLVTIGGHAGSGRKIGDVDFGPAAAEFDEADVTLAWYDYLVYGKKNRFADGHPVRIFVMGKNEWRDEQEWPLARAKTTKYFLHSEGKANSVAGDGALSTQAPVTEPPDSYHYDAHDPVPTSGGPLCCDAHEPAGPKDQSGVEKLQQVLVYSTTPFATDMEVTGPVSVELYASSSVTNTDFTAKLVDVDQHGYARNLTEGIVRASYRDSQEKPEPLKPGEVYPFRINLAATSNVFLTGHTLRLEISSSNNPRFDLNQGGPADNRIYHDAHHPSVLRLSLVSPSH
jgi:uncharacterized protein